MSPPPTPQPGSPKALIMGDNVPAPTASNSNSDWLISLNIRSYNKNIEELISNLDSRPEVKIICLQEVWQNVDLGTIPSGFNLHFRERKECTGGGVATLLANGWSTAVRDDLSTFIEGQFESLALEAFSPTKKKIIIINIYRPPQGDLARALKELSQQVDLARRSKADLIIVGDFNVDVSKNNKARTELQHCLEALGLVISNKAPTRVTNKSSTTIDLVIGPRLVEVGTENWHISDHCTLLVPLCQAKRSPKVASDSLTISPHALICMANDISKLDWDSWCLSAVDSESATLDFLNTIEKIAKKYAKKSGSRRAALRQPWYSQEHRSQKLQLNKLLVKAHKSNQAFEAYTEAKRAYKKDLRTAKERYYLGEFQKAGTDGRKIWKLINSLLGRNCSMDEIGEIDTKNGLISETSAVGEYVNNFFSTIGDVLAAKLNTKGTNFKNYNPNVTSVELGTLTADVEEVGAAIEQLPPKTSFGLDYISNKLIKLSAHALLKPLHHLYNLAATEGRFPSALKVARVIYLYKGGKKQEVGNWRPISLLSCVGKLFEKIINKKVMDHMDRGELWFRDQYGFREGHSTSDAILKLVSNIQEAIHKQKYVVCIFVDVAKAFNCLNPNILKEKLSWYNIVGGASKFISDYLSDRHQVSQINGVTSSSRQVALGVPQGGAFSTTAYILYNNDLHLATNLKSILYADDTTLLGEFSSLDDLEQSTNLELEKIGNWFKANELTLNAKKSHAMIFVPPRKPVRKVNLSLCGVPLKVSSKINNYPVRFLGLQVDPSLSLHAHWETVKAKVRSGLFALNQAKHKCPKHVRLQIYHALIHSHLSYAGEVWPHLVNSTELKEIFVLQKKAIRIVAGAKYNAHTGELFKTFNIVKAPDIAKLGVLKLCARRKLGILPSGLESLWNCQASRSGLRRAVSRRTDLSSDTVINQILMVGQENADLIDGLGNSMAGIKGTLKKSITSSYTVDCSRKNCPECSPRVGS